MKRNIQSDHLVLFTHVAQLGSFSKTSKLYNIPVSTISRRIVSFEESIGEQLIKRNTKGVQVTELGLEILAYGKKVTAEIDALESFLEHKKDVPHGTLRVSMPAATSVDIITEVIHNYKQICPEVTMDLRLTDRFVDPRVEDYDIVFNYITNEPLKDSSLIAKRIATPKTVMVCSPEFKHNISTPTDLNHTDCVTTLERDTHSITWTLVNKKQKITVKPKLSVVVNNQDAVKSAILNGYGIGRLVLPSCKEEIKSGKLVEVLKDWEVGSWDVYLMYPSRKYLPTKTQKFIELISILAKDRYYE
ncbi:MAG: LysR family transcriptional regulator [Saccharospirillaceae bacterium]|nr:LysR family transcriptional regulator [Saccharospirillaceae bacterium]